MSKKTDKGLIVGLDIGTSKVVAIVGEATGRRRTGGDRLWNSPVAGFEEGRSRQH